ncbi:bromodomain-containing protein [Cardiosporidium cionae]|uniref:Bromodomain-containing protein n=1 Tax=Cardiosporidium cionae TaxID=476202 RepID=A0ABQ7J889_9APIC|nr:bromodomain-containing protein [Cardiosporidium cionae]|eukprot:KAF8820185.1 bromodomain-containing protein [Cardiosporidium cionae]
MHRTTAAGITLKSAFVDKKNRLHYIKSGSSILSAIECVIELDQLLDSLEWRLRLTLWESLLDILENLKNTCPVLFLPYSTYLNSMESVIESEETPLPENHRMPLKTYSFTPLKSKNTIRRLGDIPTDCNFSHTDLSYIAHARCVVEYTRNLLWKYLNSTAFNYLAIGDHRVQLVRSVYHFLFGWGCPCTLSETHALNEKLVEEHMKLCKTGAPLKKFCIFKQKYTEKHLPTDWLEVAHDAICSISEMSEAKFLLNDPEAIIENYRRIIREPIWLKKIEAKARNRMYKMAMEFKSDVAKVFRNAKEFISNSVDPDILPFDLQSLKKDCALLEEQFEYMWCVISRTYQAEEKRKNQALLLQRKIKDELV